MLQFLADKITVREQERGSITCLKRALQSNENGINVFASLAVTTDDAIHVSCLFF